MIRIANGLIVDGTGASGFLGDVYVEGDRIESVIPVAGRPSTFSQGETIDATGCLVTPGFIDAHAHSDAELILEPGAPSKITQGITTEVNGQCGGSIAPRYGEARLPADWTALLGERLTWRSLAEYRRVLEAVGPSINTIEFIGHNTLRASVVGYAGRAATHDEISRMEYLLAEALEQGAAGISTGLVYQPGRYASMDEIVSLAKVVAARGGLYTTHMRSEGDRILESIDEVIALCERTGIRAEISHLKTGGRDNWSKIDAVLERVEDGISTGCLLGSDRYPYCASATDLDIVLPDWAQEGAAPAEMERLADPATRRRIVDEINASDRDWSEVMIGGTWSERNKGYSGKIIGSETENVGEFICSVLESDGCKTGAFFFGMCEANLAKIYAKPWIVPGSDAPLRAPWGLLGHDFPHPRAYATMPEFYRRVRALGVSRENAVSRMTRVPAERFGLKGRGVLRKGAYADIVVWNEAEFKARATFANPHRFTEGVKLVLVNGKRQGGGRFLDRASF